MGTYPPSIPRHVVLFASVVLTTIVLSGPAANQAAADDAPNTLTAQELADGWILLFDGQTTFGWQANNNANWQVAGGIISATEGDQGLLHTTNQFGDYLLKVDFRAAKGGNSGIFLRTAPKPKRPGSDCYELNIATPDNPFPTGSFVRQIKVTGVPETDEWRTYEVTAEGGRFLIKLDGETVLDFSDPNPPLGRGYIGLQFNRGKIEFRNVKLKPLGTKSIFNGQDLSGWEIFPGKKSVWSVTPAGELNVKNGNGQLESTGRYGDFVLQLKVISNGKHLNSGIFFRSIPGEFCNGYESQIHNGYQDGDRSQPLDYGTGGFYRFQKARQVVADDFEWFHKTLVVTDDRMAAWVNGLQVSDFVDERAEDENPRQGKRTAAGTLIFQGHDPTTDLSFRNIRIAETPNR